MNYKLNEKVSVINYRLGSKQFRTLNVICIISLICMLWHDLDHLRVVMHRSYPIQPQQFVTVAVAYIPALGALYMSFKQSQYAALISFVAGVTLLIGFILLHIIGTSAISTVFDSFLGEWKVPFSALHSDALSWLNLIVNMIWSGVMSIVAIFILAAQISGRLNQN